LFCARPHACPVYRSYVTVSCALLPFPTRRSSDLWDDLAGDVQLLDENTNLTVQNLSMGQDVAVWHGRALVYGGTDLAQALNNNRDRKSTRLNSSHVKSSYAVFCLKKKKKDAEQQH